MNSIKKTLFKRIGLVLIFLILAFVSLKFYDSKVSTTKIAFINYPEFQLSRISKSNQNNWVKLEVLEMDNLDQARDYAAVFIFGRGFQMSPEQMQTLQSAGYAGVNIFVESATNPNVDVTNLKGEILDKVSEYLNYGGTTNYASLLSYVRNEIDGKTWFSTSPEDPYPIPRDVFIHLDEQLVFEDYEKYSN